MQIGISSVALLEYFIKANDNHTLKRYFTLSVSDCPSAVAVLLLQTAMV
ncbi:Fur family transcriptional regulator [Neisseria meningitidis]|nr:Fur family transcriptional regulator [Neisseria meningitidis]